MSYNDIDFDYPYLSPKDRIELMDEGQGSFRIQQVVAKTSKSGNRMLEVMFKVTDMAGRDWYIYDYLIATMDDESGIKRLNTKIGNIAKSINKPEIDDPSYNKRNLVQDLLGFTGKCHVKIQEDKSGNYPDKNVISKFLPYESAEDLAKQLQELNDPIPF